MTQKKKKPARAHNEGTIFQRKDGRWVARIVAGIRQDGQPDKRAVYCKTKPEAVAALKALHEEISKRIDNRKSSELFSSFLARWLHESKMAAVRQNTWEDYASLAKNHVIPALGDIPIGDIKTADIQRLYDKMTADGKSASTVHKVHVLIGACLRSALPDGMLDRDPTQGTTRSSGRTAKKLLFTAEQESIFLQTVLNSSSQYRDFCLTVWELGGRTSEVLGLKWSAVFDDHIRIENVLIHTKDGDQDAPPKTPGSLRTVYLSKECMELIRRQPRRYVELPPDEKTGAVKRKLSEYVFTDAKGRPHSHRNWRRQWDQWLITAFGAEPTEETEAENENKNEAAEIEADEAAAAKGKKKAKEKEKEVYRKPLVKVTPHSLRHLQAVRLFDSGWTIADVQARGGWESPKVLVSIYSAHSTEKKQRDMAEAAKITNGCQIGCQNEKMLPTEAEST